MASLKTRNETRLYMSIKGAVTLSLMPLSIMPLSIMALSIMTLSITTLSIMTFSKPINKVQHLAQ